jgi:hypoxanthine phosphoribosyltransferase
MSTLRQDQRTGPRVLWRVGQRDGSARAAGTRLAGGGKLSVAVELLISQSKIRDRLAAIGRQIEEDYREKPLTIVAVLTGSLIALADLVREIRIPLRIALVQASSYQGATTTATTLVVNEAFAPDVAGRDVLLLDDILDTGQTLSALVQHLKDRGAASVRTAVLLRKIGRQIVPFEPDYCGFVIPDVFVVGYGLDFNDEYRHLPYVGVFQEPIQSTTGS